MNLIFQKNSKGCGIACAAMITNIPYDNCKQILFGKIGKVNGMMHDEVVNFITSNGFVAGKRKYTKEIEGPLRPEGDFNLLEGRVFQDSEWGHFIVMDKNGILYDPLFGHTNLNFYDNIWSIIGFNKI